MTQVSSTTIRPVVGKGLNQYHTATREQPVINERISEDIMLDLGKDKRKEG